jgi:hypothetical protein
VWGSVLPAFFEVFLKEMKRQAAMYINLLTNVQVEDEDLPLFNGITEDEVGINIYIYICIYIFIYIYVYIHVYIYVYM